MENRETLLLEEQNNCFVIDWLTFVAHGETVDYIKWMLGLDSPEIPWETSEKFRNGYPCSSYWNGITISFGADDPRFYRDSSKVRTDMGICVNLSGTGCRAFESYGSGNWLKLFAFLFRDTDQIARDQLKFKHYNITRVDLAFDDHTGILDIKQLETDTRERNYVSRSKNSKINWSDNQDTDIQGMTIQIGSPKSDVLIRIYDKAAERGFKDRHWIRCEIQLRAERAAVACRELLEKQHIGRVASGILRNYLTFRERTLDSNPSRWPLAAYWDRLLLDMEKIQLWIQPGEPYNVSRAEHWLVKQYGPTMVVLDELYGADYIMKRCHDCFALDDLAPKYKTLLGIGGA